MYSPLITVIITTYNRPHFLQDAIDSVIKQSYEHFEIIVINDYGEDVWDIIESYHNTKILYLSTLKNSGPSFARNCAIQAAKGELICYLDDDDLFLPNHLETAVRYFQNPKIDIIYTDARYVNEELVAHQRVVRNSSDLFKNKSFSLQKLLVKNYFPINSIIHRHALFNEVGLFDERLRSHEDWDFLIRLALNRKFFHVQQTSVEVRNRIFVQDNISTNKLNDFLNNYKFIYNKYKEHATLITRLAQKLFLLRVFLKVKFFNFTKKYHT